MSLFSIFGNNNTGTSSPKKNNIFYNSLGLFGNNNNISFGDGLFSNSQQNTSLFNNNKSINNSTSNIFSSNNNSLFSININNNNLNPFNIQSNNNSLFTNNGQNLFQNNNNLLNIKDFTIGYQFKGLNIQEKNGNATYMSISSQPEFLHASQEELRIADYELKQTGTIVKF